VTSDAIRHAPANLEIRDRFLRARNNRLLPGNLSEFNDRPRPSSLTFWLGHRHAIFTDELRTLGTGIIDSRMQRTYQPQRGSPALMKRFEPDESDAVPKVAKSHRVNIGKGERRAKTSSCWTWRSLKLGQIYRGKSRFYASE